VLLYILAYIYYNNINKKKKIRVKEK
jgi:hypothetical protein